MPSSSCARVTPRAALRRRSVGTTVGSIVYDRRKARAASRVMAGLAVAIAVLLPAPALDAAEQQTTQVFVEDFEVRDHVAANWVTSVTAPPWQRTNERAAHGAYSLTDSPGGDYASGVDTWARTAVPIDVAGRDGCGLRYALRLAVAPPASGAAGDRLLVETSSDATHWTTRQVVATGTA